MFTLDKSFQLIGTVLGRSFNCCRKSTLLKVYLERFSTLGLFFVSFLTHLKNISKICVDLWFGIKKKNSVKPFPLLFIYQIMCCWKVYFLIFCIQNVGYSLCILQIILLCFRLTLTFFNSYVIISYNMYHVIFIAINVICFKLIILCNS